MSYDITKTPCLPASHRRLSVEDSTAKLVCTIRSTIDKLTDLWDKVHMEKDVREKRIDFALDHVYDLLNQIVSSEEEMINNVKTDIEARRKGANQLRKSFGLEEFDESPYPNGSIALLKALNKDLLKLEARKEELLSEQTEIYNKLVDLGQRIDSPFEEIEGITEVILLPSQIQQMKETLETFERILNERIGQIEQLQAESRKIYENLSTSSNISLEEIKLLNTDYGSKNSSIPITNELVEKCIALNEKLKSEYDIWIEQVAFRYDELLIKLDEISHKCFRADGAHIYPSNFDPTNLGERDLQKLEEDVKTLEEKYERGRPVFDKLNEWMSLWKEKLNAEQRVCRTSFYNQRGGNLQASLKRQKAIAAKVPKSFEELRAIVAKYVEEYDMKDILIEGMCPDRYAEFVMEEYERDREVQRSQKVLQKHPNSENRTRFQTTNKLRSRLPTVAKTVNRPPLARTQRPLIAVENNSQAAPKSASRKRSLSCDASIISPLRTPILHGPKTSSPKNVYPTHGTLSTISGSTTSGYAGTASSGYGQTYLRTPSKVPKFVGAGPTTTPKAPPSSSRPWY